MTNAGKFRGKNALGMSWSPLVFFMLMGASLSLAQLPTATILGVVRDSTGAVVPGVNLTARNTVTRQSRTTMSASDGSYRFSALPVGNYGIRAEHTGFRVEERSGLTLAVDQEAVVNLTLEVGTIEQTVAVTAEAPLVNTTSGSLGGLVNEDRIADLPLNGRNISPICGSGDAVWGIAQKTQRLIRACLENGQATERNIYCGRGRSFT